MLIDSFPFASVTPPPTRPVAFLCFRSGWARSTTYNFLGVRCCATNLDVLVIARDFVASLIDGAVAADTGSAPAPKPAATAQDAAAIVILRIKGHSCRVCGRLQTGHTL